MPHSAAKGGAIASRPADAAGGCQYDDPGDLYQPAEHQLSRLPEHPGRDGRRLHGRRPAPGPGCRRPFPAVQLYSDAARSNVWGALGETAVPVAVDFVALVLNIPVTRQVTVYGRLFGGQTGKAVGQYQSSLAPIVARRANYVLVPPSCASVGSNATTLTPMTVRAHLQPYCLIAAAPLDFGTIDGLTGHAASTNLAVNCTLDAAYSIGLDGGSVTGNVNARRMRLGMGPATIDYQLYRDSGLSQPWGDAPGSRLGGSGTGMVQSIPVHGWVPPQARRPPGAYTDTITATITY